LALEPFVYCTARDPKWQILLQKSAVIDNAVRPFHLGRLGKYPTPTLSMQLLHYAQSLSGWRPGDKRREAPQVLSNGGQNKLVLSASWTTQSKPTKLQDALQVREPHLDLLTLTA
jgi:hypothetical protein